MSSATARSGGHGPTSETVRVEHDGDDISPSLAVVEGIADLADVEPVDLADEAGIVLYEHVDPDALDSIVNARLSDSVNVSFTVASYEVSVDDADVVVRRSTE